MIITENILRSIIRNVLLEMIDERGTNMQSLYHFTTIRPMLNILRTGELSASSYQRNKRNGKNFISFTRHRSNLEGFAGARELNVRIEVDGQALSNVKNSDVRSFEYYAPNYRWVKDMGYGEKSAKAYYLEDPHGDKTGDDERKYMSQAEESFETFVSHIPAIGLIKGIDIFIGSKTQEETLYDAFSIEPFINKLLNLVHIYFNMNSFNLQNNNWLSVEEFLAIERTGLSAEDFLAIKRRQFARQTAE